MFEPYLDTIIYAFTNHPYIIIFVGLIIAGESILLPAIFLAIAGKLSMPYVVAITVISTTLSDTVWFYVGRHMQHGIFRRFIIDRVMAKVDEIAKPFDAHKAKVLFASKFVYGTRTAVQILAGARGMEWRRYIMVNFLGVLSLTLALIALGYSVNLSLAGLAEVVHRIEVVFLIFVALVVAGHFIVGKYVKKKWYQQ
ncbi:MAG: VTT domain-containing protein [bacterium]|nr:VTT domain-containing protein [bacterium]